MKIKIKVGKDVDVKYLLVSANVRHWEDSEIDGKPDTKEGDNIPCKNGDLWKPIIDIDSGKIINWEAGKTASIHYKVCDAGTYELAEEDMNVVAGIYNDYVPKIMCPKEDGYGDYIIIDVDSDGIIDRWDKSKAIHINIEKD